MASSESTGEESGSLVTELLAAADMALAAEDVALAREHAGEALRLAEARPDGLGAARARLRMAHCDLAVARVERAHASAAQVAAVFRLHEERADEVAALTLAARAGTRAGRTVEAVEAGLLAVALAESLPPGATPAQAFCALGAAYAAGHHFASADRALRTASELAQRSGEHAALQDIAAEAMLAQFGRHASARGAHAAEPELHLLVDALERARAVEAATRAEPTPPTVKRSLSSAIALAACLTGDVDDALRRLHVYPERLRAGIAPHWTNALESWTRMELAWHAHDLGGAVMHAAQVAALAEGAQHAPLRSLGHHLAADLHENRGDVATALIEWKSALQLDRASRARDLESRTAATGALLATRQHQQDVATLTAKAERYQQLAYEDSLTGIPNLRRFEQHLVDALVANADSGDPLCVAFIDCDDFRAVNNNFGHELGNDVLRQVAVLLQRAVREGDIVARLGGDEFAILFRDADLGVAREVCARVREAVSAHDWRAVNRDLRVGISIGVEQSRAGDTMRSFVERADGAMYEMKMQRKAARAVATPPVSQIPAMLLGRAAQWLANAERLVVFTGAGLAGVEGPFVEAAPAGRADAVALAGADAALARQFWQARRSAMAARAPTRVHRALLELAGLVPREPTAVTFVTERIDGLLQRAGAGQVIELFGSALRDRCGACGAVAAATGGERCLACGHAGPSLRPDVVLPGELPDARVAAGAELAAKRADLILVVEADAQIFPSVALLEKARVRGARIVMIGTGPTTNRSVADVSFDAPVEDLLHALIARVASDRASDPGVAGAPRLGDEACSALGYLSGNGTDHRGRTLAQTLALSDAQLQGQADVTQWQFPAMHRSAVCPEAPVVTVQEFAALAEDDAARGGMRRAFLRMLDFYGLEWREGAVRKSPSWLQRFPAWARAPGSNDLRISRILGALTHCGLRAEALAFLATLEEEVPQVRDGDVRKPLSYWRAAVRPRRPGADA